MKTDRRDFIRTAALLSFGAATQISKAEHAVNHVLALDGATGPFELPPLGYAYDALEPFIDAQTMQIHHDKHHLAYVTKLNEAIEKDPSLKGKSLDELLRNISKLPAASQTAVRNQGGGHWNHSLFWQLLKKDTKPGEKTLAAIKSSFGSMEKFTAAFEQSAMGVFGSGWTWLIHDQGKLSIVNTANQDNPIMDTSAKHGTPVLCLDVWEHAYYLKYQNKRADYVHAFWNVANWDKAEELLKA